MSSIETEIRWYVAQQGPGKLAVEVSIRQAPSFAEEIVAVAVIGTKELVREFQDLDRLRDLLKTWLLDEPSKWRMDSPGLGLDPAAGRNDDALVAEWGKFLGRLLVERVVGRRLDDIVRHAVNDPDRPTVRLLFALRDPVARRLPVELLSWPNGPVRGPIAIRPGLSVLREALPGLGAAPTPSPDTLRIVMAGVPAPDHADEDEWHRLVEAIDNHGPSDFRGRVGPDLTQHPAHALESMRMLSGDVAVLWGHGVRQQAESSSVWSSPQSSVTSKEIAEALGDRYGAAVVAMCFSASEGEHGEPSVVSRLASSGASLVVGFRGRPETTAVTEVVHEFVGSLRAAYDSGIDGSYAHEMAVYRARTNASDAHNVGRQIVAEVSPHVTAGRLRWPRVPAEGRSVPGVTALKAYRTAGQLLITRIDGRLVRIPLPVDPLEFMLKLDGDVLLLNRRVDGLESHIKSALTKWPGASHLSVDVSAAKTAVHNWGLESAMFDAVMGEVERLVGERRPNSVDELVRSARRNDWGSPPAMSVIQVETGAITCRLGVPPEQVRVQGMRMPGRPTHESVALVPNDREIALSRLPAQDGQSVDWKTIDRAIAGDRSALEGAIEMQLSELRTYWKERRPQFNGDLPTGCLGIPALTRLVPRGA